MRTLSDDRRRLDALGRDRGRGRAAPLYGLAAGRGDALLLGFTLLHFALSGFPLLLLLELALAGVLLRLLALLLGFALLGFLLSGFPLLLLLELALAGVL
ncbi:MAG: hypothetical protein WEB59_11750, partial [Thermoanaerobaculia bacterium]